MVGFGMYTPQPKIFYLVDVIVCKNKTVVNVIVCEKKSVVE